ncbi:hypothetical protein D0T49_01050 [Paludibacter sp. 221]|uniref:lysophospholipid acyltransferase family protein n=1 Tax=Paludibacter sp. 221 TaxID=2302939 RepID=UPI0013D58503|nr:lysophospholipid acyltransferase family protein [Paludibacter sp. 221]NDV45637.1 hypothetical protein [Paludibacter sp. 221]
MYYIFYAFAWVITLFPLRVLYLLSDFCFLILYYIVGYRKKVTRTNLRNSFPEKSEKERRKIERRFYRYFCDLFVETLKLMHMSKKQMNRRMVYINGEFMAEQYAKGKSVMLMTSHYGNWEWTSSFSMFYPDKPVYQVYRRLKSKNFDRFMYSLRVRFGAKNIEKNETLRAMVRLRNESKLCMFGMLSDQTPSPNNIHHRVNFLNQDTPVITGTEQLAKKFDYPVVYVSVTRVKRGYYKCEVVPIAVEPTKMKEFEITEIYTRMLEDAIRKAPEYWLWTHKRWKHKRK